MWTTTFSCLGKHAAVCPQKFLSTECCQYAIKKTWKRGYSASIWTIMLCMATIFPTGWLIQFETILPRHCRCPPGICTCNQKHYITTSHAGKKNNKCAKKWNSFELTRAKQMACNPFISVDCGMPLKAGTVYQRKNCTSMEQEQRSYFNHNVRGDKQGKTLKRYVKKLFTFYYSPVVKFINHTTWYVVYLLLYIYVMLFSLGHDQAQSNSELFLYFWQFTFICEEIRVILWHPGESFLDKLADWWIFSTLQSWNRLHMVGYFFSVIIFIMRSALPKAFAITKMMFVINFLTYYVLPIFKAYVINEYLGPKVVMITRMTRDLVMFLLVFFVFMISYSVTFHAFYHPQEDFRWSMIPKIFTHGIWEIFGEVNRIPTRK